MSNPTAKIDTGVLIRRSLFFLVLVALTLGNLFTLFRGLNAPAAMDQAQIAREVARGNGFTTKFIRPVAYQKTVDHQKRTVPFTGFQDTYHSPLNPLLNAAVFKLIGADDADQWRMADDERIFPLDRVIATVSTLCFLISIGVCYLLVSRIFDAKIAAVTAILMLFCDTFWNYSLSGLPQMLMLLLFSCALYFVYRAVEESSEGRVPFVPAIIAAVFFTLLSLTHFLTVWIALGYIIFAAVFFRPRGIVGLAALVILIVPFVFILLRNNSIDGSPFGVAFLNLYNGIGGGKEDIVMRTLNIDSYPLLNQGFLSSIIQTTLTQTTTIVPFLGAIIVAPLFFLSLLHPFRRPAIANFRWAILIMFAVSAFGLAIFGISTDSLDPNQTHLLFAPIMTAYGLAFVSILWSKLPVVAATPLLRNVHYVVIIGICALPLALALPRKVKLGMDNNSGGGIPHWPPYWAPALNLGLSKWLTEKQICFSDQPWAVAWYADRVSVWLPLDKKDFIEIETNAANLETPIAGILISPTSHGDGSITTVSAKYKDFASIILDGRVFLATYPPGVTIYDKDQKIQEITRRYPYRATLVGMDMVYYSDRALRAEDEEN
ncbi:glycosyltransferase family 39 protein [Luteolibacter sp. AS25]|uniref:glycosyltransferase family 39 protein n=1 Tax=Luteolibacter sp. AS25 TaxID=3135776 RepID=UPI00398AFB68